MSNYQELYKKYRPKDWDGLVGQTGVVRDLRKEVVSNQIPTAYLFAGKQHGCGKTSAAWIMAKAVNCENLDKETGNPCNECQTCKNIDNNNQLGVHYVSMANNGSVKDANDIIRQAQMSQPINRPVWILDESHRMSKEAAEAWLIPLESPNMKALFIFCSTEPERMIDTVKSRVQQKSFRSINALDIYKHLEKISQIENLELTEDQLKSASLEGNGSLRNALQNLEVIARDGKLAGSYKNKILSMLASRNYVKSLEVSAEMESEGQDYLQATQQLYRDFSDMLLLIAGATPSDNVGNPKSYLKFASSIGPHGILEAIKLLGDTVNTMVYNTVDNRILFEVLMFKLIEVIKKYISTNTKK
ncbi:MAG TPA: hypothetical protein GXZ90_04435 [Clostridiales bacterium]|nr:hypothetical protein [Clostridiales bacterium]